MQQRLFGNTGLRVSSIGFGAWLLNNPLQGGPDETESIRLVHAALDAGCNFFDTAPGYGDGASEQLLGQALRGRRREAVICTKFGHTGLHTKDFSVARLRPSLEGSLRRLQTDQVEVLLLHNPPADRLDGAQAADLYGELLMLQREGKLRAFGASMDWSHELRTMTESTPSRAAEVLFNIFHQEPRFAFAGAAARGVGLIVKVPLDSGWLSGKYDRTSTFEGIRNRWPRSVIERRAGLVEQVRALLPAGVSMPQAALRFVLAHPEVSTVIPGAKDITQLHANVSAAQEPLPAATIATLRQLWQNELRSRPLPW